MARDNADYVFYATLDDSKAQAALDRIEAKAEEVAKKLTTHFNTLNGALDSAFKVDTQGIDTLKSKLAGVNVDALLAQISTLEARLNAIGEIPPIKLQAPVVASPSATTTSPPTNVTATAPLTPGAPIAANIAQTTAAADVLDQRLKQLIATELLTTSTGDKFAQSLIKQAQAGGTTADEFGQIVLSTGQVSQAQLTLATAIAQSKQRLETLNASLRESGVDRTAVIAAIQAEQQALIANEAALEKAAAAAQQAAAEKLATAEQIANAEAETNKRLREDIAKRAALEKAAEAEAKKTAAARNAQLEQTKRILAANVRSVTDVRNAFATLAAQSGQVVVKFNALESELTDQDKRVLKLIQSNKQLGQVYNSLAASVGRADIAFDSLDFPITKMRQLGDEADKVNRKVGGLGEAVKFKLISAFENLARTGVDAFRRLASEASRTAEEFRVTQLAFEQILGDPDAAMATFNLIRRESERTGTDITTLITKLLPTLVDPRDQIPQIAEIARGLLRDPIAIQQGKNIEDVTIALSEILSGGQAQSLRFRFNVPANITRQIVELSRTQGAQAALDVLIEYLEALGLAGSALDDTLTQARNNVKSLFVTIKGELGSPINEAYQDFFVNLNDFIVENREPILEFAYIVGEAFSSLIELFTTQLEGKLNVETIREASASILEFITGLERLNVILSQTDFSVPLPSVRNFVAGVQESIEWVLSSVASLFDAIGRIFGFDFGLEDGLGKTFDELTEKIDAIFEEFGGLNQVLQTGQKLFAMLNIPVAGLVGTLAAAVAAVKNLGKAMTDDMTFAEYQKAINDAIQFAIEPYKENIRETARNIDEQNAAIEENTKRITENAAARAAARQKTDPIPAVAGADQPTDDQIAIAEDTLRKRLELEKKYIDKELDIEIEVQRKRVDIWSDYYRKLIDLDTDFFRALDDAALDYERDQADLATDIADKQADIERESAKKRLDIETDYLRKLEDLRRKFQFDAGEAIRANDAIRFLQLKRQLEFDRRSAAIERDRKLEDQAETESDKLEDLKRDEARKRAELKLEYERELEDIRIKDAQKRQDAILARQRALEDLLHWEADKRADLLTEYERELAEFGVFQKEKEEGTTAALAELQKLVEAGNQALADTESEFYKTRIANFERFVAQYQRTAAGLQVAQGVGLEGGEQSEIDQLRRQALLAARTGGRPDLIGQIISAKTIAELRAILEQLGITNGGSGSSGGGTQGQQQIRNLQAQARRLASTKGVLAQWEAIIAAANRVAALQRIIRDIDEGKPPTPRAKGGPVYPNRTYMVGEAGPEILTMGRFGGHVTPMMDGRNFNMGTVGGASISSTTNNTFQNNFSMLDPNSMSAGQIAIMQQVMGEVLMRVANRL